MVTPVFGDDLEVPENWRFFGLSDGLREASLAAIEVGPKSRVWVTYERESGIESFDGFSIQSYPSPPGESGPIHASRTGQIWALRDGAIWHYSNGEWSLVARGLAELSGFPWRTEDDDQPIALVPAEFNHAIVATATALYDVDAVAMEVRRLWSAERFGFGALVDLCPAPDVGAWVVCERGVVRVEAPLRRIRDDSVFRRMPGPDGLDLRLASSATPDEDGGLTLSLSATADAPAMVARFSQGRSESWPIAASSPIAAWRGPDAAFWLATTYTVQRFPPGVHFEGEPESLLMPQGRILDVGVGPEGLIAVATSRGLFRYAAPLWRRAHRTPVPWSALDEGRFLVDDRGRAWWLGPQGAFEWVGDGFRRRGPCAPATRSSGSEVWVPLAGGRVLIPQEGGLSIFSLVNCESVDFPIEDVAGPVVLLRGEGYRERAFCAARPSQGGQLWIGKWSDSRWEWMTPVPEEWNERTEMGYASWVGSEEFWLGGVAGLARWADGVWRVFGEGEVAPFRSVNSVAVSLSGQFWFGGESSVSYWDGRQFQADLEDVGPIRRLFAARDGSIWALSAQGLFERRNGLWSPHGTTEGLPMGPVLEFFEGAGRQFFAITSKAVYRFDPSADTEDPQTWITTGALERSPTSAAGTPMRFRGEDRWRHTKPSDLLFSHRLDANEWSPFSSEVEVMLGGLTPGEHTFEVRAMDRNRNIDLSPASLSFRWTNPWYRDVRTVTAATIGAVFAVALGALAFNRHRSLQRSYAEVEKIVRQRTAELERANQELLLTQKMRALGTLTAGVAHDFNSILSIIGGSAQIIGQFPNDREKVLKRVDRIRSVVDQGANLVKAMLGVPSSDAHAVSVLDVNAIMRQTSATLVDRLPQGVRIELELSAAVPKVTGNPSMVRQMIVNLSLNAADALGEGGVVRLVSERLKEEPPADLALHPKAAEEYVAVSVVDTGIGIQPDELDRIFEPFYTTKHLSARRGTGLGLSMVYEMASRMGYGIHVRSKPGEGASFTILIPEGQSKL